MDVLIDKSSAAQIYQSGTVDHYVIDRGMCKNLDRLAIREKIDKQIDSRTE